MMKLFGILLAFCSIQICAGQDYLIKCENAENIKTDVLGNIYLTRGPELLKYNSNGKLLSSYSNPIGNDIGFFDPSISTNVLTYHQAFQELVILDNTLNNLTSSMFLIEYGYSDVSLLHSSDDQNIWVYDRAKNQLSKFHIPSQKRVWESPNLNQMLEVQSEPVRMIHTISGLYLLYENEGIAQFDIYGNFIRFMSLPIEGKFFVMNGAIVWARNGQLRAYEIKSMAEFSYSNMMEGYEDFSVLGRKFYVLKEGKVYQSNLF